MTDAQPLTASLWQYLNTMAALRVQRPHQHGPTLAEVEAVLAARVRFTEALLDGGYRPPRRLLCDLERDRLVRLPLDPLAQAMERTDVAVRVPGQRRAVTATT